MIRAPFFTIAPVTDTSSVWTELLEELNVSADAGSLMPGVSAGASDGGTNCFLVDDIRVAPCRKTGRTMGLNLQTSALAEVHERVTGLRQVEHGFGTRGRIECAVGGVRKNRFTRIKSPAHIRIEG